MIDPATLSLADLARGATPILPVCIKSARRWLVDSGINGHVFNDTRGAR